MAAFFAFFLGGIKIEFSIQNLSPSYLAFLRKFDIHVPTKDTRPWLMGISVNNIPYGIPLTTQLHSAGLPGFLCSPDGDGLQLRFMVPVVQDAIIMRPTMDPSLRSALGFFNAYANYIEQEAQLIYVLASGRKLPPKWRSCDFQELESVYSSWQPDRSVGPFLYPKSEQERMMEMPVSKNGVLYYTKDQYNYAKYCVSALDIAQAQNYELERVGSVYRSKEHDSMIFSPTGRFFWNSRGIQGGAIEFLMYVKDMSYTEAILTICEGRNFTHEQVTAAPRTFTRPERPELKLPFRAGTSKQLYGYLAGQRCLHKEVLQEMQRQQSVYQSVYRTPTGKEIYNAAFVYYDANGKAAGVFQRGLRDPEPPGKPFKRDVPGSNKDWGFLLKSPELPAQEVRVFEGAIDAASDASLDAYTHGPQWKSAPVDRLALGGCENFQPLYNYLQNHPQIRNIALMLDTDDPGKTAAENLRVKLEERGYKVDTRYPRLGKDWNEELQIFCGKGQEASLHQAAEMEAPVEIAPGMEPEMEEEF